ncbi:DUF2931 family protein, partial [Psychromonas sp.]|nr:DUF2931 family protein [Psychromonas sp.]
MRNINKLISMLSIVGLISGCNMTSKNEFEWSVSKSGPSKYPVEILSGTLYYKGLEQGHGISTGAVGGGWGTGHSSTTPVTKILPDRLDILFYSYLENQSYRGQFELPYDKLVELFQWGIDNPKKRGNTYLPMFSDFIIGVAPGGTVGIWLAGQDEQREVF